jgi:hypothetical protein
MSDVQQDRRRHGPAQKQGMMLTRRVGKLSCMNSNEATIEVTPRMVSAGLAVYIESLGDDRPIITDEKDLVTTIYLSMEKERLKEGNP